MPRVSLSQREVARARQRLSAAALRLYKQEGYAAVSFRKLASVTGSSHTHPYRYFENKEGLFAAVRFQCFQRFTAVIRDSDILAAHPAVRLESIHAAILEYVRTEPAEYQLMFALEQPGLQDYPELLAVRCAAFDYLVDIVQNAIDLGLMHGDARSIMHVVWGAVHGLLCLQTAGQLVHGRGLDELTRPLLERTLSPLFDGYIPSVNHRRSA